MHTTNITCVTNFWDALSIRQLEFPSCLRHRGWNQTLNTTTSLRDIFPPARGRTGPQHIRVNARMGTFTDFDNTYGYVCECVSWCMYVSEYVCVWLGACMIVTVGTNIVWLVLSSNFFDHRNEEQNQGCHPRRTDYPTPFALWEWQQQIAIDSVAQ